MIYRVVLAFIFVIIVSNSNAQQISFSKNFINCRGVNTPSSSVAEIFNFSIFNLTNTLDVTVAAPFTISKDGINFFNTLTFPSSINTTIQTLYVRCTPLANDKVYQGQIQFTSNSFTLQDKVYIRGTSMPLEKHLKIASWNMRWFGFPGNCNCDTALARVNALEIIKNIDADIYCLQEVVDTLSLKKVVQDLGSDYEMIVSKYCSLASSTSSGSYTYGQKLAYIIKKSRVTILSNYGLMASTYPLYQGAGSPHFNWASGRFPFLLKAKLKTVSNTDTLIIANIHGKAFDTPDDYVRREGGAHTMVDSLNTLYPNYKKIIIGDHNDYYDSTICSSYTVSPYSYLFTNNYIPITKNAYYPLQTTYIGSMGIIDNISCSQNLFAQYPDSNCYIFSEVQQIIPNYKNTTSDHLPVISYFRYTFPLTNVGVTAVIKEDNNTITLQNPSNGSLHFKSEIAQYIKKISILDMSSRVVMQIDINKNITSYSNTSINLPQGVYTVLLQTNEKTYSKKWQIQK